MQLQINTQKILNKTVKTYHARFLDNAEAQAYLREACGIHDGRVCETFQIGYADGQLATMLPGQGSVLEQIKEIGVLTDKGEEYFLGCVTIPVINEQGDCTGIYGVNIANGGRNNIGSGVFNPNVFRIHSSIVAVDDVLDALRLYQAGITNVTVLNNEAVEAMMQAEVKTVYTLQPAQLIGFEVLSLNITDVRAYFEQYTKKDFEILTQAVRTMDTKPVEEVSHLEVLEDGLQISFGRRQYVIRGVDATKQRLKVNIKAVDEGRFHIDTVDLYVSRARKNFAREVSLLYNEDGKIIDNDMNVLIVEMEKYLAGKLKGSGGPVMGEADKEKALAFLKSPDLIERILKDFDDLGCCGETTNKLMGYLAAVSRKLKDPLSLLILSRSAAGKSMLQDTILNLVPDEDKRKYTRITGQALFYKGEDSLKHKIVAIEEEEGSSQAAYSIRTMQSSKQLTIASTIKDPLSGVMKTQEYKVNGPLSLMMTTTRNAIDYETMNRFIVLTIDETDEQTRLIHQKQREQDTLNGLLKDHKGDEIITRHQNAQRLLKQINVVNPYAPYLTYMDGQIRARRDHKKYLNLIKAIAFLHQHQREIKELDRNGEKIQYIEVSLDDIQLANKIAGEVLSRSLDELSPPSKRLLKHLQDMSADGEAFTRKDIRDYTQWSDYQVRTHLKQLVDLEYVALIAGRNGALMKYKLIYSGSVGGKRALIGLSSVEEITSMMHANLAEKV